MVIAPTSIHSVAFMQLQPLHSQSSEKNEQKDSLFLSLEKEEKKGEEEKKREKWNEEI